MDKYSRIEDVRQKYALLVDPHTGQEFNVRRLATSLGRSESCDVMLNDKSISRQHAVIYSIKGKFFLEDVGSTNGTSVNKQLLNGRIALNSGDEIRIGIIRLVFLLIPDRSPAQPVPILSGVPTQDLGISYALRAAN